MDDNHTQFLTTPVCALAMAPMYANAKPNAIKEFHCVCAPITKSSFDFYSHYPLTLFSENLTISCQLSFQNGVFHGILPVLFYAAWNV